MKLNLIYSSLVLVAIATTGCFKSDPAKETMQAGGSWKIEKVTITNYDSLGVEKNSATSEEAGFLMLSHTDDFLYENSFSAEYYLDRLTNSEMYLYFGYANIWGVAPASKTFNLSSQDPTTGFTSPVVSYTVLKLNNRKMDLQYVRLHPITGAIVFKELWQLKRATH
ncbi:MAG: hypothetical protein ACRCYO_11385 [Bacteroidia bacterium]